MPTVKTIPTLGVGIKTFMRETSLVQMVESVQKYLPEAKMYIADDSEEISPNKLALYNALKQDGHTIIRLPYDQGISVGRNAISWAVREPYLLLCDDDYIITEDNGIDKMIKAIEHGLDADVIAGRLIQDNHDLGYQFDLKIEDRAVKKLPNTREVVIFDGMRFQPTDLGLNFFLAKTSIFPEAHWDNKLITSTEHIDFFLTLQQLKKKVYYCKDLVSAHVPPPKDIIYHKLRYRKFHWLDFANKWDVDWCEEEGERLNYRTEAHKWASNNM